MNKLINVIPNILSEIASFSCLFSKELVESAFGVLTVLVEVQVVKGDLENQVHEFLHVVHVHHQLVR
jgi:hypothetical protein